jgi:hypothetical protein
MWKFRAVTPLTVTFNTEFTAKLIFRCLTPGTVDVKSYATIYRPTLRVANVLFFHSHEKHCFYSHARTAVIFITVMVGNLKSCSSSGPWWNNAHAKFRENTLYACFFHMNKYFPMHAAVKQSEHTECWPISMQSCSKTTTHRNKS